MIVLMNGHGLTPKDRFVPEAMSLQLSERQSTASMTLSPSAPALNVDDWVQIEDGIGAGTVWRVKTIDTQYNTETRTVQLEHVIQALKDRIMFGEVKSAQISNTRANPTARQAFTYVLNQQSDWVLGDFDYNVSNPYSFNGDDLLSALETVSSSLQDCIWEYSFASYPFTLHVRRMSDSVASEMRMDRNIRTLRKTIDRSRMYTRHYPIGKNNLHIDGDYTSRNENLYGIVSKVETDNGKATKEELLAWSQERLNRHCEPCVTVTVSGLDLSESTGEALDSFTIGRKCQVPLPEFSTVITERVTKLSYPDIIRDPENVTVTLANELQDVATILKEQGASGGRSGRNGAKNDEEDHAWFVDTTEKVEMVAEAVAGKDGEGANWSRVSQLTVDGSGIDARVTYAEGELVTQTSRITQNEKMIQQEVLDRSQGDSVLSGRITVEAGRISQVVSAVGKDGVVTAASIVLAINQSSGESEAKISADRVYIGSEKSTTVINGKCSLSDVTASYIGSKLASLASVSMQEASILTAGITTVRASNMYFTSQEQGHSVYTSVKNAFAAMQLVQEGQIYTLQYKRFSDSEWQDIGSFERAASTSTTLSGSWSGNTYTVTAIPQGNVITTSAHLAIEVGGSSLSPNTKINAKIYKDNPSVPGNQIALTEMTLAEDTSGKKVTLSTAAGVRGEISTQATYNAGANSVTVSGSWSGTTYTATTSGGRSTSTNVVLAVEGAANPNATVYAKIYKNSAASGNQIANTELTLVENVSAREVILKTAVGSLTKGRISTVATYNAGHNGVGGTDIILSKDLGGGIGTETTAVPSSDITKANGKFSGYVWLKEAGNNYYKNLRAFSFTMPATASWSYSRVSGSVWNISCTVAGKTYTSQHSF